MTKQSELEQVKAERDAAQAAYALVCEAVTPGCVGGAEATAIMAALARIRAQKSGPALRRIADTTAGGGYAWAREIALDALEIEAPKR